MNRRYVTSLSQDLAGWRLGGKAAHLARLQRLGDIPMPRTVAVDARALASMVQSAFRGDEWTALVDGYRRGERAQLFAEVAHAHFPGALMDELQAALPPGDLLIVRSSALQEDAAHASLAGHYESVLTLPDADSLAIAIKTCWLVGLRVLLDQVGPETAPDDVPSGCMAVIVQPVVPARCSGVYFSHSPLHPGRSMVAANWGTCHSVVGGTAATDEWVLRRGQVENSNLRFKFEMTVTHPHSDLLPGQEVETAVGPTTIHEPKGRYLYQARVPRGLDGDPALTPAMLAHLDRVGRRLHAELRHPVDVEWTSPSGEDLVVLQVRPITTRSVRPRRNDHGVSYGIASAGVARGPVRKITSPGQLDRVHPGDVLSVVATDPDYMPMLYRAAALLSEEGSPLSHTAIVARELRIPCLLGVPMDALREGEMVTVDARSGLLVRRTPAAGAGISRPARDLSLLFDASHLDWHRGAAQAALTLSALLDSWEPRRLDLPGRVRELEQQYQIGRLRIVADILDLGAAGAAADPMLEAWARAVGAG